MRFKKITSLLLFGASLGLLASLTLARPISYKGGWTSIITNDGEKNSLFVHYSPSVNYSLGYKLEYWQKKRFYIHAMQLNNLIYRLNARHSQTNVYLKSGVGITSTTKSENNRLGSAAYTGIAADWEDQRYFISYENRWTHAGNITDFFMQNVRLGFAPYIGEYEDLHTWVMVQVDHMPQNNSPFTVTPLFRFFKGTNLVEIGRSSKGKLLLNWIKRF